MITHDHKIIFTHIPKCAGRSVCTLFNQRFDHYTSAYYQREYTRFFERYNKFTIVRNPFDRMVSLYFYIKAHRRHQNEAIAVIPGQLPDFKTWLLNNIKNFQGNFPFSSAEGCRGTDGDLGSSFWFSSQYRRICDEQGDLLTDIFRLEHGTWYIDNYLSEITGVKVTLPHVNKNDYPDFRTFYDDELIEAASNFMPIKEDCKMLSYTFHQ